MLPSLPITAARITVPCTCAVLAIAGYAGSTFLYKFPWITPDETLMRDTATLGIMAVLPIIPPITPPMLPPGTPPGTPPTTPDIIGGGASSSLIISTFLGILVGVRSCPFTMSVCTCRTWTTAAGGGGGGGGGGATSAVFRNILGNASVNNKGSNTMNPMIPNCTRKENIVVAFLLSLSLPPDSIRLSSN